MSALTPPQPAAAQQPFVKARRRRPIRTTVSAEYLALFVLAWASYGVIGWFVVLRWHILETDAAARLAHALAVWFDQGHKLATIGFVWPPLMTLVLLPFALVKPLATSLLALPVSSALFGAGLVVALERTLAMIGLSRRGRWPLTALVAVNPMIAFYAANGMAEMLYLFLLAVGVAAFVRWTFDHSVPWLVLSSGALTLGVLSRYELLIWAFAVATAVALVLHFRGEDARRVEATVLTYLTPPVYALGVWAFLNWLIVGNPFFWLTAEVSQTFEETRLQHEPFGAAEALQRTLEVTWHVFPATFFAVPALLVVAALRRDVVAFALGVIGLLNPATTAVLGVLTQAEIVFELRYNMRGIPVVLIGLGWLCRCAPLGLGRRLVWTASLAVLGLSIPITWGAMETSARSSQESAFVRALSTGADQEGVYQASLGKTIGVKPEQAAARWVIDHVDRPGAVLVDDAKGFAVILFSGRPDVFFDRPDAGDDAWRSALERPRGQVQYFLVSVRSLDLIRHRYSSILENAVPWLERVYANSRWEIFRVEAGAP